MTSLAQRALALSVLAVFAGACGDAPAGTDGADAGDGTTTTQSAKVLTRVGPGNLEAHPGDHVPLQALLSQSEVGPIAGAKVTFKLVSDESGVGTLDPATDETDDHGTASASLAVSGAGELTVKAESAGATSKAVWKVSVERLRKTVNIIATNETFPLPTDSTQATVSAGATRQVTLRVRVTVVASDQDQPLGGEEVTFDIQQGIPGAKFANVASGDGSEQADVTQADGEASVVLAVGDAASATPYRVTASLASNESATFTVTVTSGSTGGDGCTATSQCPPGRICQGGHCTDPAVGGNCGDDDRPCPIGYHCNGTSGQCEPGASTDCGTCPDGTLCDPATGECVTGGGCSTSSPCPDGFSCVQGVCNPNPSDGSIDVTGHWYTKHTFNIADALPTWVKDVGAGVRAIDQTINGQLSLPSWASWANPLIAGVLRQYIPDWVYKLVAIMDDMFTIFSMLRSEGEMDLVANGGPRILAGTEFWSSFVFYMLEQCNGQISGSIWQPPACARFDIATDELAGADLAVNVKPFSAKLTGTGPWAVEVDRRQVEMKLAGLIKYVIDQILYIATGYPSLEDKKCCTGSQQPGPTCGAGSPPECGAGSGALSHLIDCEGVNEFVQSVIGLDVTTVCQGLVSAGGNALASALTNITITDHDLLEFDGKANAYPGPIATEADTLGKVNADALSNGGTFTQNPGDGLWNGHFHLGIGIKDVPGRWYASRNPLAP